MNAVPGMGTLAGMQRLLCLLCAVVFTAGWAHADYVNGRSYVSLGSWARANNLTLRLAGNGTEYVLTNRIARLHFEKDSADATVNGVDIRLCFPVAKGGLIAQLDIDKTLRPLLYNPRPAPRKITTICLDPGHGGRD
ncbi:MAG TPA: hypothetical protein VF607_02615, partial [Verrucomicrobiae bacterium]